MPDLVLHHYDAAPFAEKIRLIFGIKDLAWHSVIQPSALPKPDLVPLTGGYRRTPVFQIGADIYCDTQLIAAELEALYPEPTIFPDGNAGLAYALGSWAHGPYVVSSVAIYMGAEDPFAGDVSLPRHFYEDRKKMWMTQFDTDQLGPKLAGYRAQLDAHTDFINMQLADGRAFLTGDKPSLVDLHAMWDPWFLRRFAPVEASRAYDRFPAIEQWEKRLAAIGQGRRSEMDPKRALEIARDTTPEPATGIDPNDALGISAETTVRVSPSDYAEVDVIGELVATTVRTVTIRRDDPDVGRVHVHFPKIGYVIEPV
ncbi:MAG: glutathione S-transferase family protein [Gammaproteobacteria bacterium]|nr:glutathione S-transferase family protein [Gammaproteobacteria bacterium]MCZ6771056.1 glutathione S-transferase family protein [Pseudomonadota bacterium]MCZ6892586.1 glutathione S-transferase family protein [Gammaproteobacteria bacterium]